MADIFFVLSHICTVWSYIRVNKETIVLLCVIGTRIPCDHTSYIIHTSHIIHHTSYTDPSAPSITSVTGCSPDGAGVQGCPTAGLDFITIYGTSFVATTSISVGGTGNTMYDVWCMMYDVWCMMYDVWCMICCVCCICACVLCMCVFLCVFGIMYVCVYVCMCVCAYVCVCVRLLSVMMATAHCNFTNGVCVVYSLSHYIVLQ